MTGRAYFNEVFFDEAICSVDDLIGGEGDGWRVAQTTLLFERSGIGPDGTFSMLPHPGRRAATSSAAPAMPSTTRRRRSPGSTSRM